MFANRCKGLRKKDTDAVLIFVGRAYRDEVRGNGLDNFFFWDAETRERLTFVSKDHRRLGLIADFLIDSVPEDSRQRPPAEAGSLLGGTS
jgi:hypothetical protein